MFIGECKTPVTQLKGIGPKAASRLQKVGVFSVKDLLTYYPRAYEDRSRIEPLVEAFKRPDFSCVAEVVSHEYFLFRNRRTLKVWIKDDSTGASLLCFGRNFLAEKFIPGRRFFIYGTFYVKRGEIMCSSFDAEEFSDKPGNFGKILPVYPLTSGITQAMLRSSVSQALEKYGRYLEDEVPADLARHRNLLKKSEALQAIHFPDTLKMAELARFTLVYEELFYLELIVAGRALRRESNRRSARQLSREPEKELLKKLPFRLTEDQKKVIDEIFEDLKGRKPMGRLLQGDVGCGKTLVAFIAALTVIGGGRQAAFMAPTELLAKQHADYAANLLSPLGVRIAFLSGTVKDEERRLLLENLGKGEIDLLVGTHALFYGDIRFRTLLSLWMSSTSLVYCRTCTSRKGRKSRPSSYTAIPTPELLRSALEILTYQQ